MRSAEKSWRMGVMVVVLAAMATVWAGSAIAQETAPSASWPVFRGVNHDGISKEPFTWPKDGPTPVWKNSDIGIGSSAVSIADGRLFTMGNKANEDAVWCLNLADGKEVWHKTYPCAARNPGNDTEGPRATPTIDGKNVYTLSRKGDLYCFEAATGKVLWQKNLVKDFSVQLPTWDLAGSPLVYEKLLILNVFDGGLALDKATGEKVWQGKSGRPGYASPLPIRQDGATRVALLADKSIVVVNPADGKELWRGDWATKYGCNAADPVIVDGQAFVSGGYKSGDALFKIGGDPKPLWQSANMNNHFHTCMLWEGYLYGVDGDQQMGQRCTLKCLNYKTGEVKWTQSGLGFGGVIIVGGKLLILAQTGLLAAAELSPEGYKELGKAQIIPGNTFTIPVYLDGKIYARNLAGDLVCVNMKP